MSPDNPLPPIVLTLAGSDPTGGAGIQADILTLASMGCHPLSVITAITVQDTRGVQDFMVIDDEWVSDQARAVLEDMPVAAFKVGMIGSIDNAVAIAELASDYPDIPLIYDPVLASGRGDELSREELIHVLRDVLLPQVTVLTPNSVEARRLAANDAEDEESLSVADCAKRLTRLGCDYVFITGTHEATRDVENRLYDLAGEIRADTWPRLNGSFHGSGCTLASAIAGLVARGLAVPEAVKEAQDFTWQALRYGFRPGMGQYIPDRLFWANDDASEDDNKDTDTP